MRNTIGILLALLLGRGCLPPLAPAQEAISPHLTLGNPSKALPDESSRDNFLIVRKEFCCSYNSRLGIPNWVSWRLASEDLGEADRTGEDFKVDPALRGDAKWPPITTAMYSGSGFDRGHLCPAADRSRSLVYLQGTFNTANMIPQAPRVNRGPWAQFEAFRRKLAADGKELYVIAGPAGIAGQGAEGWRCKVAARYGRPVTVPACCWATCIVLPDAAGNDLDRIRKGTAEVFSIIIPNCQEVVDWERYRSSVDAIEELTGLDLYDLVDERVQKWLEFGTAVDPTDGPASTPRE